MTTARDLVNRAIVRSGAVGVGQPIPSEDAGTALDAFNDMLYGWKSEEIDIQHSGYTLNSTVMFFVPPPSLDGDDIAALTDKGNWDANANSPTLASNTGTRGDYYKVSPAGSTTLNDVTSWAIDDYAVFNGSSWIKGHNSKQLEWAILALLTVRISDEFGQNIAPSLIEQSDRGMRAIEAAFLRPKAAVVDGTLEYMPSRRYAGRDVIL